MAEFNQDQQQTRPELDEPRRTTESGVEDETPSRMSGGYGGVTEEEPPHHTDDEPLPKPASGANDDNDEGLSKDEQVLPTSTDSGYGDAPPKPQSTEDYQDYRSSDQPQAPVDETPASEEKTNGDFDDSSSAVPASDPRSFGEENNNGGYSDPSSAFPDAPVDRKLEEPGYGQDTETPAPVSTEAAPESPTPKKEGLMAKIMDKLPGHHKTSSTPETVEDDDTPTETGTPKKGLMTKIKEKLPGHHATTPTVE